MEARINELFPLAAKIAREFSNIPGLPHAEIEMAAQEALANAARRFDPAKGDFTAYAARAMRNALRDLYERQVRHPRPENRDAEVCEPGAQYVLRRNPRRAGEMQATRQSKLDSLARRADQANLYLTEHPQAKVGTAVKSLQNQITKLKLASWVSIGQAEGRREVQLRIDFGQQEELATEIANRAGCPSALKTIARCRKFS